MIRSDHDPTGVEASFAGGPCRSLRVLAERTEPVERQLAGEAAELFVRGRGGVAELAHRAEDRVARAAPLEPGERQGRLRIDCGLALYASSITSTSFGKERGCMRPGTPRWAARPSATVSKEAPAASAPPAAARALSTMVSASPETRIPPWRERGVELEGEGALVEETDVARAEVRLEAPPEGQDARLRPFGLGEGTRGSSRSTIAVPLAGSAISRSPFSRAMFSRDPGTRCGQSPRS